MIRTRHWFQKRFQNTRRAFALHKVYSNYYVQKNVLSIPGGNGLDPSKIAAKRTK